MMSKKKISPRGTSWDEFRDQMYTPEEIAESKVRRAIINEIVQAREEEGITQKPVSYTHLNYKRTTFDFTLILYGEKALFLVIL